MFDPKQLLGCEPYERDGSIVYEVSAGVLYPKMAERVLFCSRLGFRGDGYPRELLDSIPDPDVSQDHALRSYVSKARELPEGWEQLVRPVQPGDTADDDRFRVQELLRLWWTRAVKTGHRGSDSMLVVRITACGECDGCDSGGRCEWRHKW